MNLTGLIIFARPTHDSTQTYKAYVVVGHGPNLNLVSADGGLLSGRVLSGPANDWEVAATFENDDHIAYLIGTLNNVLDNTELRFTEQGRHEARLAREVLMDLHETKKGSSSVSQERADNETAFNNLFIPPIVVSVTGGTPESAANVRAEINQFLQHRFGN